MAVDNNDESLSISARTSRPRSKGSWDEVRALVWATFGSVRVSRLAIEWRYPIREARLCPLRRCRAATEMRPERKSRLSH